MEAFLEAERGLRSKSLWKWKYLASPNYVGRIRFKFEFWAHLVGQNGKKTEKKSNHQIVESGHSNDNNTNNNNVGSSMVWASPQKKENVKKIEFWISYQAIKRMVVYFKDVVKAVGSVDIKSKSILARFFFCSFGKSKFALPPPDLLLRRHLARAGGEGEDEGLENWKINFNLFIY